VITAFLLGLMGSLHCAGMCGPLVLMTPVTGKSRSAFFASKLAYHAGRLATYALLGAFFGLVGESLVFAGIQRWLSLLIGILMLLAIFFATPFKTRLTAIPMSIKKIFGKLIHSRTLLSIFALGATNGLLPCGLVYAAATASIAVGSLPASIAYMLLFGLGTLPMLLAISLMGQRLPLLNRPFVQKLVPITVALVGLIMILRSQPLALFANPAERTQCPVCIK
jgi:hypothetical protein